MTLPPDMLQRLRRTYGFDDTVLSGPGCLVAAHHRMRQLGVEDEDAYLEKLLASEEEFEAFVDELLVPESWFFRDRAPFDFLARWVQSEWSGQSGPDRMLRVLSVPCASGPEPYSIAMTLLDSGLPEKSFRVYAGDVSERNLVHARHGEYRSMAFRGKDAEGRRHHFEPLPEGGMRVREQVRRCVSFKRCNLLDPGSLVFAPAFDVIFCRNVLIYFCEDARRSVVGHMQKLLADGGLFFVGHADGLSVLTSEFEPTGPAGAFCYRRRLGVPATGPAKASTAPARKAGGASASASASRRQSMRLPARSASTSSASASASSSAARLTGKVAAPGASAPAGKDASAALLQEVARLADQGNLDAARERCLEHLQKHKPSADALFLLGQIEMASSRLAEAETCIRKALYLNPNHLDALVQMALLAERRGSAQEAQRLRARARKLEAAHV